MCVHKVALALAATTTITTTIIINMASRTSSLRLARLTRRPFICQPCRRFASAVTSDHVNVIEMGPRDGLQNEKNTIPLATKLELINRLAKTGLRTIEAGSFVSPKWVPQVSSITPPRWQSLTEYLHRWPTLQRYYKAYCKSHQSLPNP
jgi:hypothetical protein